MKDGNTLYIDRNGNGDLTEPGEKVAWTGQHCLAGDVTGPDGKPLHTGARLSNYGSAVRIRLQYANRHPFIVGDPDADPLVFADRPAEAPVAHIGGPLSIKLGYYGLGGGPMVLQVWVGTPGLGKGSFAARVLPPIAPVAKIEFPSKKRGAPPIVTRKTLESY